MRLVDPATLAEVLDAATVSALGDRVIEVSNAVVTSFAAAHSDWQGLRDVFHVEGTEGIHFMLDRPLTDAREFARTLTEARTVLWDAASLTLPDLKSRRDDLAARIAAVNIESDAADAAYDAADTAYWAQWHLDRDSSATAMARDERTLAGRGRTQVFDAAEVLRDDIARFRADVEAAEDTIAAQLARITGGTEVHGAWGETVRVSQTYWGFVESAYPGAPFSLSTTLTLAEHLEDALSDNVAARIGWLGSADADAVRRWMAAHPDFASAVGFVDPERAARLWSDLAEESTAGATRDGVTTEWAGGPLAQLLALAPLAVGNLNGAPASQRNLFAREGLRQILDSDLPDDGARDKLDGLWDKLRADSSMTLLSVFLDTDGEPRASVAWGDVDTADQITTLSHGIQTDLGLLTDWSRSSRDLRESLDEQLRIDGSGASTAVVLFLEWDSGDAFTVQAIDRPDAGAARLAQLLGGFAQVNPDGQRNLVLHSLGTTMGAQTIADNPELVDNVWFVGSAGITAQAGDALAAQIDAGELVVHATHASADWIAPLGRSDVLSEHPVDPRDVDGVQEFSAEGGFVAEYGEAGARGEQTEGHNAQRATDVLYWGIDGWTTAPDGTAVPVYDTTSTGYLDPVAESFLRLVVELADAADLVEAR